MSSSPYQHSAAQPPPVLERQTTFSAYTQILGDFPNGGSKRPWSIRQANSRLHGLESAFESDLTLHLENQEKAIPMTVLSDRRQSNNPYLMADERATFASTPSWKHPEGPEPQPPLRSSNSLWHKTYGYNDPFAEAPMEAWQAMKDYNLRANGLPTLDQMMRLPTAAPLTQSNFITFLRRRGVHQNLNFLLELETHAKLWRAYVQSVERQNRQSGADRLSRFLESAAEKPANIKDTMLMMDYQHYSETPDTQDLLKQQQQKHYDEQTYASRNPNGGRSLDRHDLAQNATRIYRTFCSTHDAAQPIHLPDDHRMALEELVEKHHRPEPIVFESAKSHVFEILNVFYYPQFVDAMLYTNMVVTSARIILGLGAVLLTFGFALELSLIFSNSGTTATRWWGLLPFFFGWSGFLAGNIDFAWWIAFTGKR